MLDQHIDPDYQEFRECVDSQCIKNSITVGNASYWLKAVLSTISKHVLDKQIFGLENPSSWARDQFEYEMEELCHCLGVKFDKANLKEWASLAEV